MDKNHHAKFIKHPIKCKNKNKKKQWADIVWGISGWKNKGSGTKHVQYIIAQFD